MFIYLESGISKCFIIKLLVFAHLQNSIYRNIYNIEKIIEIICNVLNIYSFAYRELI